MFFLDFNVYVIGNFKSCLERFANFDFEKRNKHDLCLRKEFETGKM